MLKRTIGCAAVLSTLIAIGACSDGLETTSTETSNNGSGGNATGTGTGADSGVGTNVGGTSVVGVGVNVGGSAQGGGCAAQSVEATLTKKPVDIIIVIDNSGSMGQEIVGVEQNINANFATIIENSGLDYRVIMVATHGSSSGPESVCIEAPLSGIPMGGCTPPPAQPVENAPRFFHYSTEIGSHNPWCKMLESFNGPDEFNLYPTGWGALLRPDAYKTIIGVSDDGVSCGFGGNTFNDGNSVNGGQQAAQLFDDELLALSPQFGTAMDRNYVYHSLVALESKDPMNPATAWLPTDPVTTGECPTAADAGTGHQGLSVLTGGLRFPICEPNYYDVVFNEIAAGVIAGASVDCAFDIPDPPPGETIDLDSISVRYTPMGSGTPVDFTKVADASACGPNSFYVDLATNTIELCPDACATVQADGAAKIDVVFQCDGSVQ